MALKLELGSLPALPRINPRLFRHLCAAAATILVAYFAARTVLVLISPAADPVGFPAGVLEQRLEKSAPEMRRALTAYNPIVDVNIFGGEAREAVREEIDLESIPLALDSLRLKLVGTVVGGSGGSNLAFIEDLQAKSQDMYREGDEVKNVTVKRILRNSVVINTGKRDEILTMEAEPAGSKPPAEPQARSGRVARSSETSESRTLERDAVESSLGDLSRLMQDAQIDTYIEEGRPQGFRFSNIKQGSFYSQLGLRNNDIILSINGQELTDPSQFLSLKEQIEGTSGVALTIRRGGSEQVIQYDISE